MEETKNQPTIDYSGEFYEMMKSFKKELEQTFNTSFEYETQWVYMAGTCGWIDCLRRASETYCPKVYKLYDILGWVESDLFDSWLIDCALAFDLCKPMDEDPNR